MDQSCEWSEDEISGEWLGDEMPTESDEEFIDDSELSEEDWSSVSESESEG